jgi:hypothetical protein
MDQGADRHSAYLVAKMALDLADDIKLIASELTPEPKESKPH